MAKKPWGNTQKSQGAIRRTAKEIAKKDPSFDTDIAGWMEVSLRQLSPEQIEQALIADAPFTESALDQIKKVGVENAEIYEWESEAGSINYQYGYTTRNDFEIDDLFRAKGKEGDQEEFDYEVFEITTPLSEGT